MLDTRRKRVEFEKESIIIVLEKEKFNILSRRNKDGR